MQQKRKISMYVLSSMQLKGGAGKTTALMALAGAADAAGMSTLLVDTDQNGPLSRWRDTAEKRSLWPESIDVRKILDFGELHEVLNQAEDHDTYDLALIDTRGGRTKFMGGVAQISDVIILPSRPVKVDADEFVATIAWLKELEKSGVDIGAYRLLFSAMKPAKGLTKDMLEMRAALKRAPHFETEVLERAAYLNMQARGPLTTIIDDHMADPDPLARGQARKYKDALKESTSLLRECLSIAQSTTEAA